MKSVIKELILDNCIFMENIKTNERYGSLLDENDKIYKILKTMLNTEQLELLDKLIFNHMGLEAEASECYLIYGFKTGLKLIVECI